MNVAPIVFREFDAGKVAQPLAAGVKPLLPGGRRREGMPPSSPASYTEEQLKAAEMESYKKGFLEGTEEGKKQAESEQALVDRKLAGAVEKFARSVSPLIEDYRQMILQLQQDMPKVALAIAKKAAGDALAQNAAAAVEAMALQCVETLIGEPKLAIMVHESVAESLDKKVKDLTQRLQAAGNFVVVRDASIPATDCRIEWKYGAMERHTGQLWEAIDRAVAGMFAAATHTTQTRVEAIEAQIASSETQANNQKE